MTNSANQQLEMSPGQFNDPVAVALEQSFDIAKKWDKTWTAENRKYTFGFGFVKNAGVFLLVTDKMTNEREAFYTQATDLEPNKFSQLMKQYVLRFRQIKPMLDFASAKRGKKLKGRVPRTVRPKGSSRLTKQRRAKIQADVVAFLNRAGSSTAKVIAGVTGHDAELIGKLLTRIGKFERTSASGDWYALDRTKI